MQTRAFQIAILLLFTLLFVSQTYSSPVTAPGYNYRSLLNQMGQELNRLDNRCKLGKLYDFTVDNDSLYHFFVYDLTDTTNYGPRVVCEGPDCAIRVVKVAFIDGHIYHFSPSLKFIGVSSLAFYNEGNMTFFSALNCNNQRLSEAIKHFTTAYSDPQFDRQQTLINIKNYQRHNDWKELCDVGDFLPDCNCK